MPLAVSPCFKHDHHGFGMVTLLRAWSPCLWDGDHAFNMVTTSLAWRPLAWSLCLWHGLHAFGMVNMSLAWSPCLQNYFVTAHIFCIFGVFGFFCNFDFVIFLRPNRWPENTADSPKRCANVLATSPIDGGLGIIPPENWFNFLKTSHMKNGNRNFSGIPKNRKAFSIFFYNSEGYL